MCSCAGGGGALCFLVPSSSSKLLVPFCNAASELNCLQLQSLLVWLCSPVRFNLVSRTGYRNLAYGRFVGFFWMEGRPYAGQLGIQKSLTYEYTDAPAVLRTRSPSALPVEDCGVFLRNHRDPVAVWQEILCLNQRLASDRAAAGLAEVSLAVLVVRRGADKSLAFRISSTTKRIFLEWVKEVRATKS
jgi:hypothetical protein